MGRAIETRFGPKFLLLIYFVSGLMTAAFILLFEFLGITFYSLSSVFDPGYGTNGVYLNANGGIYLALICLFAFIAGMDTPLNFMLFIIPIRLKAKHIIYLLVGINLVVGLIYLFTPGSWAIRNRKSCKYYGTFRCPFMFQYGSRTNDELLGSIKLY